MYAAPSSPQKAPKHLMETLMENAYKVKRRTAGKIDETKEQAFKAAEQAKVMSCDFASDQTVQASFATLAGTTVGAVAGINIGVLNGTLLGAAVGIVPGVFTFGLAIPACTVLGGAIGASMGGVVGGTTGGAAAYASYKKQDQIESFVARVRARAEAYMGKVRAKTTVAYASAKERVTTAYARVRGRSVEVAQASKEHVQAAMKDGSAQVTAASAATGAIVLGSGGAAVGCLGGGALGAAVGIVPAFFTFGLSIPVFAVVGSGAGAATGSVVGGTAGAVTGGATGYGVYTRRETIRSSLKDTLTKVDGAARYVKETASTSADYVRARIAGGTGGTD